MSKSLDEGFETLLKWLSPKSAERDKVDSHKASVESCLVNNLKCYEFFETGSFGNETGISSFSDSDFFSVIPTDNLNANSSTTLRRIKEALQETFWATEGIEVHSPAVRIPFGEYASETMEVVPCDFQGLIQTPEGSFPSYDIPDGTSGWMKSSPKAHNAYVKKINLKIYNKLKPLIRLIKAWKYYNQVPISSFYLELRITKYAENEKAIIYDYDIKNVMNLLSDINLANIQDPMGVSGYIVPCTSDANKTESLSKIQTGLTRATKAVEEREKDLDKCFYWWNMFFSNGFPSR